MSTDSEDSVDDPANATESALHNALRDMHRSRANVQTSTAEDGDGFDAETSGVQGKVEIQTDHHCCPFHHKTLQLQIQ